MWALAEGAKHKKRQSHRLWTPRQTQFVGVLSGLFRLFRLFRFVFRCLFRGLFRLFRFVFRGLFSGCSACSALFWVHPFREKETFHEWQASQAQT